MSSIRFAVRQLRRNPGFAITAVLILGVAAGASNATFGVVNAVLLKPLPYRNSKRLVAIWDRYEPNFPKLGASGTEFNQWRQQGDLFEELVQYSYVPKSFNLTRAGAPERVEAACVSANFFPLLGITPALGRIFAPGESGAALISRQLWRARFASEPTIIGKAIHLNDRSFTVIGVLPETMSFPVWASIWLPIEEMGELLTNPVRHGIGVIGLLRQGASSEQANARLNAVAERLEVAYPRTSKGFRARVVGLQQDLTGDRRSSLLMLLGAVLFVLLIGCANIANLLLSRAAARKNEIAIRLALGATRGQLLGRFLTEGLALALPGAGLGLLLAGFARVFGLPVRLEGAVVGFSVAISALTAVIFGFAPAGELLRENATVTRFGRTRSGLIVAETALAVMLLAGAGLLMRSFFVLMSSSPGFQPEHVLTLRISADPSRYPKEQQREALFRRIAERVESLPGVSAVGAGNFLPVLADRASAMRFVVPGSPAMQPGVFPVGQFRIVTPGYFQAMGIPLRAGRFYSDQDAGKDYVIVNETMARRFWPGEDAAGKKFITGPWGPTPSWSTVIGVVGDVKQFGLDSEPTVDLYFLSFASDYLAIRSASDPAGLAAAVRHEIQQVDQELPISEIQTMEQVMATSAAPRRVILIALAAFAAAALLLASLGIYGVLSWSVTRRTRELGIRAALGARQRDALLLVIKDGLALTAMGLAIGLAGTLALRKVMSQFVFAIGSTDPVALSIASALMLIVAFLACVGPAWRAARLDPACALRQE